MNPAASAARCPALLVAAPASGQGKTTVAAALARLHSRQGKRVRVFKCGPDFLDPFWLALASGSPVYQLDLWMTGAADCQQRLHAAAVEADLIIVEGVMGLFDGQPSAADLAQRFDLPVLAVVDASAMAGTFGALAYGLQHYRPGLRWAGVLANRVASPCHAQMLQDGLRNAADWLGALPRDATFSMPERHLGLAHDVDPSQALARLDAAADAMAQTPLGRLPMAAWDSWAVDFSAPEFPSAAVLPGARDSATITTAAALASQTPNAAPNTLPPEIALPALLHGKKIAVARDAAFCFIYTANLDCLLRLGAELLFFSPLANQPVPACDAVWLPGGYPELHLPALVQANTTRSSLARHIGASRAVWAECGGMMALMESITPATSAAPDHAQGNALPQPAETPKAPVSHPAWGLVPGHVSMQQRLAALGSQQLTLPGGTLRGHTFHYSTATSSMEVIARTARPHTDCTPDAGEALYRHGSVLASYFHAWFASSDVATGGLFGMAS